MPHVALTLRAVRSIDAVTRCSGVSCCAFNMVDATTRLTVISDLILPIAPLLPIPPIPPSRRALWRTGRWARRLTCPLPDFLEYARENLLRAADWQVADIEMPGPDVEQRADGPRADLLGGRAGRELAREPFGGNRNKPGQCRQRPRIRAPVKEHPEDSRQLNAAAAGGQDEPRDRLDVVVAHHLRQVELRQKLGRGQEVHLPLGIRMRIRPAAEDQRGIAFPEELPQLPGVRDHARDAEGLVAPQDDERRESILVGSLRVRCAVLD